MLDVRQGGKACHEALTDSRSMIFAIQVGNATLALPTVNRVKAEAEIRQQKEAPRGSWRGCARLNIASISSTACHRSVLTKSSSVHPSIHRVAASTLWRSVQLFTRFSYKELKVIVELDRGCVLQHCSHLLPRSSGFLASRVPSCKVKSISFVVRAERIRSSIA